MAGELPARSCFVAGTLILTKDGHKPIDEIQVGEEVYSYNPETGEKGLKPVVNTFVHDKDVLLNVYIGELKIETTEEHPFWVADKGWVLAGDLEVGDQLLLHSDEIVEITELEWIHLVTPVKVYNFEVKDWHTYFVSEIDVFVHNKALKYDPDAGGFSSFRRVKKALGPAGKGNQYHHIVEQSQIAKSGFLPRQIHHYDNVIAVPKPVHRKISSYYSSKRDFTNGLRVRDWLAGKSFEEQMEFGLKIMKDFGVMQ
ncbi:MAG: hypothetical protein FH749_11190 [Firmicutes bacterium]|nr:hypothetical protein [Bacillota bacterium]